MYVCMPDFCIYFAISGLLSDVATFCLPVKFSLSLLYLGEVGLFCACSLINVLLDVGTFYV